jgi:hypothetical protein
MFGSDSICLAVAWLVAVLICLTNTVAARTSTGRPRILPPWPLLKPYPLV